MKTLIKIFLFLTLQSCSNGYIKSRDFKLSENLYNQSDSSVIITKTSATSISTGALDSRINNGFTEINWCRFDEKKCKEIFYSNPYKKKKFNNEHNAYRIKSGFYYLNQIKELPDLTDNLAWLPFKIVVGVLCFGCTFDPNFNNSISGYDKVKNAPNFASFETNPGEIVYIGDLFFTFTKQKYWIKGKINLEVKDNYNEAVNYFYSQYPEYKNQPVIKRLAKPGVLLDNYDAGIFW